MPSEFDMRLLNDAAFFEPRLFAWHFGAGRSEVELLQLLTGELCGLHSPALTLAGTDFELVKVVDPVLGSFFNTHVGQGRAIEIVKSPSAWAPQLMRALRVIADVAPDFHGALSESLRAIALFEHPSMNSFAALGLHGMIFLNLCRPPSISFFVDGLVHQGGHVLFSEATLERRSFFNMSPDECVHAATGSRDSRSLYEVLHGVFTEFALVEILDRARGRVGDAAETLELSGRVALNLTRFEADLSLLTSCQTKVFRASGLEMLEFFRLGLNTYKQRQGREEAFDLHGQPDEFDIDLFLGRNAA